MGVCEAINLANQTATITGWSSIGYPPVAMTFDTFGIDNFAYTGGSSTGRRLNAGPGRRGHHLQAESAV